MTRQIHFSSLSGIRLAVVLALLVTPIGALAESLTVGYFEAAPHVTHQADGSPAGPAIDLFKVVAAKMGIADVRFQRLPLARLLLQLKSGETDMALFISKTPKRELDFYYPPNPYYVAQPGLAVMASSQLLQIKSVQDMRSLKIGLMNNTALSGSMGQPGLNLDRISGDDFYERAFRMLVLGRLDAMYSPDSRVLLMVARTQGLQEKIRVLDLPDPADGVYYAFSHSASKVFSARYAKAMEAIVKERGNYERAFLN
jgi:ABC-type amino acid transport substrate-binding protein